jgi:uncharacterized protein YbgA (DUF1722 family)/uncharacterized protein YbbK (DUF523 family)
VTGVASSSGRRFARPVVVVSRCLELEACRYNAQLVREPLVRQLEPWVHLSPVCPEVEIGLGVPRDAIRLVRLEGRTRLVQPATGRDVTDAMIAFAAAWLGGLADAPDGFLLKNRSPSCGIKDVKVYAAADRAPPVATQAGLFAAAVLDRFPDAAVEDEGRLRNPAIREHFLTRLFTRAAFREVRSAPTMRGLVAFQTANKLLLMGRNQTAMRELGRVVANAERRPVAEVLDAYAAGLARAFARAPRRAAQINVAQHAFGYVSDRLSPAERRHFLDLLEEYRAGRTTLSAVTAVLGGWVARFEEPYLTGQTWFEPYPRDLTRLDHG